MNILVTAPPAILSTSRRGQLALFRFLGGRRAMAGADVAGAGSEDRLCRLVSVVVSMLAMSGWIDSQKAPSRIAINYL
jgi:hypothetical protein